MSNVTVQQSDHILTLTINRPDKKNALTREMYLEMANAITYAMQTIEIKMILIKGSEGVFTAGNDMYDFIAATSMMENEINETEQFMTALMTCELPIIAQVEGLAIGIGTTLLLHCDFVYAADNARFKMPFINLGLVPEYASSYILPRLCGHVKAAELLLLGKAFDAQEAEQLGFINAVLPAANLSEHVSGICQQLTALPHDALRASKQLLKHDAKTVEKHMHDELKVFVRAMRSDAAKEAFTSFVEKRKPDFSRC